MYEKLYSDIANSLVNDGYIVIHDALQKQLNLSLLSIAKDENSYKKAGISNLASHHVDNDKRSDRTKWIDADDNIQSEYLKFCDELRVYLNRSLYLGLSYYESHFAIYEKGDFYEKHLDAFKSYKNRVVTTVYYLNEEWDDRDGGELIIYDDKGDEITKVAPTANTLVVFLSERFPHEVLQANKKRYSIAGWFRIDKN